MSIKRTPEIETLAVSRMIRRIGLGRRLIIQAPMDPLPIRENLDRGKDRPFSFLSGSTCRQVNELLFQEAMPGFHQGMIIAIPLPTYAGRHPVLLQVLWVPRRGLWASPIRGMQHAGWLIPTKGSTGQLDTRQPKHSRSYGKCPVRGLLGRHF